MRTAADQVRSRSSRRNACSTVAARTAARTPGADATYTALLEALERRIPGPAFEAFTSEIFS